MPETKTLESVDRRNFRSFGTTISGLRVTQSEGYGSPILVRGPLKVMKGIYLIIFKTERERENNYCYKTLMCDMQNNGLNWRPIFIKCDDSTSNQIFNLNAVLIEKVKKSA